MQHANALNRLDRLPVSRFHKITLLAVSFAYFFEFADINSFATTAPKLIKLWGVTVDQVAYVTSLSFVGMFFGSIVAGSTRRPVGPQDGPCCGRPLFFGVFSFAAVFSWDLVSLGVFRVLTSAGLSAMTVVAVIYINEMYPSAIRGKYQAYAIVIGICGTPVTNLIASAVVPINDWSWRLVYLWGSLGILLVLFTRHLKESPRWLREQGRARQGGRGPAGDRGAASPRRRARCPSPRPRSTKPRRRRHRCGCCCRRSTCTRRCC